MSHDNSLARTTRTVESTREHIPSQADAAEFAAASFDVVNDCIIAVDRHGSIKYLNAAASRLLCISADAAAGMAFSELLYPAISAAAPALVDPVKDCFDQARTVSADIATRIARLDDREVDLHITATPMFESSATVRGAVVVVRDTSELRRLNTRLTYEARHDSLTSLVNRRELIARVERLLALRHVKGASHALLYLDLDRFKYVNDSSGHAAGDLLLRQVALLLKAHVRQGDTVARLGGDEFVILLEDCTIQHAMHVAQGILDAVDEYRFEYEEKVFRIGVSVGAVAITRHIQSFDALLNAADKACYSAKKGGRHRAVVYREDDLSVRQAVNDLSSAVCIERALDDKLLELHGQEIVSVADPNRVVGIEFLLRLRSHSGELIEPGGFLPSSERLNFATRIDRWVVGEAIRILESPALAANPDVFHAINVSPTSIANESFLDFVDSTLAASNADASRICFELTETAAIEDFGRVRQFMQRLCDRGCTFAIDDFGSGLNTFEYFHLLPVSIIKIDGAFAKRMCNSLVDRTIVKSINDIAHVAGKRTVLEHIENEVVLAEAKYLGIDYCQGRYISDVRTMT